MSTKRTISKKVATKRYEYSYSASGEGSCKCVSGAAELTTTYVYDANGILMRVVETLSGPAEDHCG